MVVPSPSIFPKERAQNRVEGTKYGLMHMACLRFARFFCSRGLMALLMFKRIVVLIELKKQEQLALLPSSSIGIVLSNASIHCSIKMNVSHV